LARAAFGLEASPTCSPAPGKASPAGLTTSRHGVGSCRSRTPQKESARVSILVPGR